MPADKPHFVINVGEAKQAAYKNSDAGHVRYQYGGSSKIKTFKPGGRELVFFDDPKSKAYIDTTGIADVHIYNKTSRPLNITTHVDGEELDDVVKTNKTFKIQLGARVTVRTV